MNPATVAETRTAWEYEVKNLGNGAIFLVVPNGLLFVNYMVDMIFITYTLNMYRESF